MLPVLTHTTVVYIYFHHRTCQSPTIRRKIVSKWSQLPFVYLVQCSQFVKHQFHLVYLPQNTLQSILSPTPVGVLFAFVLTRIIRLRCGTCVTFQAPTLQKALMNKINPSNQPSQPRLTKLQSVSHFHASRLRVQVPLTSLVAESSASQKRVYTEHWYLRNTTNKLAGETEYHAEVVTAAKPGNSLDARTPRPFTIPSVPSR